jgi:uncharacterized protein
MKQTALITGASSGIGLELARVFAKNKINLLLVARSEGKLKELSTELSVQYGVTVGALAKDLGVAGSAKEVFDYCQNQGLQIDYLVNNAGYGEFGLFSEGNLDKQLGMIDLNITALTHLTGLFLPVMIKNKFGKVLNVASTAAFQPGPTMAIYYASKAYVLHFSEAIANELEGTGVTVTALCPGATESNFFTAADMHDSKLVKGKKLPSSKEVAEYGFSSMMNEKRVAIHGWMNYIMANSARFTPRNVVVKIVRMIQDK